MIIAHSAGVHNVGASEVLTDHRNTSNHSGLAPTSRPPDASGNLPAAWFLPDPYADETSPAAVCEAAERYVAAGLSVIPISAEHFKQPDWRRLPTPWDEAEQRHKASWKVFQLRRAGKDEIQKWFEAGGLFGIAVVGGVVSGGLPKHGLEIIDFDTAELAAPWLEKIERRAPGLIHSLIGVQSPRPGLHVYYRCPDFGGSQKLACGPQTDAAGIILCDKAGRPKRQTLIELKGEGGYCLVPPSPRDCHPRNKIYRLLEGSPDLTTVPIITPAQRAVLLEEARAFNQLPEPEAPPRTEKCTRPSEGGRPGDDFNERAEWSEILEPHGWTLASYSGGVEKWRRPDKDNGHSATVNYSDRDLLIPFSTNAEPFEAGRGYTKFAAYAMLNHEGDFRAAAEALQQQGYGGAKLAWGKRGSSASGWTGSVAL